MKRPATEPARDDLESSVDGAIAACGGDARAAVRVLLVTVHQLQAELNERDAENRGVGRACLLRLFARPA
jgi:hypothetical protein